MAITPEQPIVKGEEMEKKETKDIIQSLWEKLPEMARSLIANTHDLSSPRDKSFYEHPDDYLEHDPNWHQWGIITHSKMFEKFYREEIPQLLKQWELNDVVERSMSVEIDGRSKRELLQISIPLHDLGKFTGRVFKVDGSVSFDKHEAASGRIIRDPKFAGMMRTEYGLTDAQVEYIAQCAENHFKLGVIRKEAKTSELGYTITFAESEQFRAQAQDIIKKYPDLATEIGILFLADSLSKTDITGVNDAEIKKTLADRDLDPRLINGIKQSPINTAIVKNYFKAMQEHQKSS